MMICGIKVSHDGGVAVVDGNELMFSIEVEKLGNAPRYSPIGDLDRVAEILRSEGLSPSDIDRFIVDGWFASETVRDTDSVRPSSISTMAGGRPTSLSVAPYQDRPGVTDPITRFRFRSNAFGSASGGYASYHHVDHHILGGYCTSPFAERADDALVLVWDGGTAARVYHVEAVKRTARPVATVLPIVGNSFTYFSSHFDPFMQKIHGPARDQALRQHLSIPGKAMAYAGLGVVEEAAYPVLDRIISALPDASQEAARSIGAKVVENRDELFPGLVDADLIATFQAYLGDRLAEGLASLVQQNPWLPLNLVVAGGCALNIKWNALLRARGIVDEIWIPPFPNDSGAAIGTACCEMFRYGKSPALSWNVYSGPAAEIGHVPNNWQKEPCSEEGVAQLLHRDGEPVVIVSGRAELGPRALGNRSILASATDVAMKDRLNGMKNRAGYRPVAPVCLSTRAHEVFRPGARDPYMLFEHRVRSEWAERIPAVIHVDGTARLQTIDEFAPSPTARILAAYERLSGIPVLCNTSANFEGRGFFPDVASAARWGGTRYIWSGGYLYTNHSFRA
ncbi:carbamoyltransferase N-terminal domain-containing protein [Nocardia wallacei]|uniref:carbamoyltransferase N-terminal domain-containing protein n=1 Tax=Nocardia wallacei TaxID=480035 RepID=UPI002458193E|nr:carbamoyltransferase N-terminal domain-containing protein [Nocardia wallacei]